MPTLLHGLSWLPGPSIQKTLVGAPRLSIVIATSGDVARGSRDADGCTLRRAVDEWLTSDAPSMGQIEPLDEVP